MFSLGVPHWSCPEHTELYFSHWKEDCGGGAETEVQVTEIYFLNSVLWKVMESFGVHYVWETLINFDTDFQKIIWTLDIGHLDIGNNLRSLPISEDWRRCTEPWKVQFQDEIAIWWLLEHVSNITFKVKHLNFWTRSHLRYISKMPFCGNPSIFESKVLFMLHAAQHLWLISILLNNSSTWFDSFHFMSCIEDNSFKFKSNARMYKKHGKHGKFLFKLSFLFASRQMIGVGKWKIGKLVSCLSNKMKTAQHFKKEKKSF